MIFKMLLHALGRLFLTIVLGIEKCHKIQNEQCIVAANHNSHIDILVLFRLFEITRVHKVKTLAARDYFSKGLGGFFARILFNTILVDRGTSARNTFKIIKREIDAGFSLIMFPEGTRGNPGQLAEFKSGIGQLAIEYPTIPIYPVYLAGVEKSLPKGSRIPVPFNIRMKVIEPVFGKDYICDDLRKSRQRVTTEIEKRIRDYVNKNYPSPY